MSEHIVSPHAACWPAVHAASWPATGRSLYLLNENLLLASQYEPGGWLYDNHSRDTGATVVDESGNVVWAPENLHAPSYAYLAAYSAIRSTLTGGQTDFHGDSTGALFQEDTTAGNSHYMARGLGTFTDNLGRPFTLAAELKAAGRDKIIIANNFNAFGTRATFNLADESVVSFGISVSDASIERLGDGWYLCRVAYPELIWNSFHIALTDGTTPVYDGDGSSGVLIGRIGAWRNADISQTILPADLSGETYAPRLQHDSAGNPLGYLHEPQATNEVGYSEDYVSEQNLLAGMSIVEDQTQDDPMGGTKATTFRAAAGSVRYWTGQHFSIAAAGEAWTVSRYVKKEAAGCPRAVVGFSAAGFASGRKALFDPSNGAVIDDDGVTATHVEEFADYWRFGVTATSTVAGGGASVALGIVPSTVTDVNVQGITVGTEELTFFGDQRETGTAPTSYIPTTGAAATRQADSFGPATINVPAGQWAITYNTTPLAPPENLYYMLNLAGPSSPNLNLFRLQSGLVRIGEGTDATVVDVNQSIDAVTPYGERHSIGVSINSTGGYRVVVDGALVNEDLTTKMAEAPHLDSFRFDDGSLIRAQIVESVRILPRDVLTDELETLTA